MVHAHFNSTSFQLKKRPLHVLGSVIHIQNATGEPILFSLLNPFRSLETLRVFENENLSGELLNISPRSVFKLSTIFDVWDVQSHKKIGSIKRNAMKSLFKNEWKIWDENDNEIGCIQERSWALALMRRLFTRLIPSSHQILFNGEAIGHIRRDFNPIFTQLQIDFTENDETTFDKRMGVAAGLIIYASKNAL